MANDGLYRRPGSPHWQLRYAGENGKIVRESSGTASKKLAAEILAKRKTMVAEGRHLDRKKVHRTTFYQLCEEYWRLWGKQKKAKGLRGMIDICKEEFGDIPLKDLTRRRVEQFLAERISVHELTAATRNRYLALIAGMLNKAMEWGMFDSNPAAGIKKLKENGARTRFLDGQEIERFLAACSTDFRPIALTALHTGMRRGEILRLRWPDVDFKAKLITVQQSKSGKKRWIPMDDTLYKALFKLPSRFKRGLVFPSPVTGRVRHEARRAFRSAVKTAKIQDFRFHDCRHTFASHLVMAGVDLKTVQELLGHHSLTMTLRYSHLAPDHRMRAIKTLDTAYRSSTKSDTLENSGVEPTGVSC